MHHICKPSLAQGARITLHEYGIHKLKYYGLSRTVTTTLIYCYFCYHSKHNANKDNIFTDDIVQKDNDCCQSDTDLTSVFQVPAKMVVTTHDVCMASHLSAHSTEVLSHAHLASSSGKLWTKFSLFLSGDWNPHGFICLQDLLIIENSYR